MIPLAANANATAALDLVAQLPALQVVVPLIGAVICATARQRHVSAAVTIACSVAMPVIAFLILLEVQAHGTISYAMGGWAPPVGIEYRIDLINAFVLLLVSIMGAVVALYAPRSLAYEISEERQAWTYSMYLMCMCGLLGMAITGDAFNVFVFMEISSLAMYTLIAMGSERRALVAAFQYLVIGTLGATFYVIGVGLIFTMTGTLNLYDMAALLPEVEDGHRSIIAGLAFITIGIGLKLAMFPMHLWLPNAYAYAPTVATAFIASTATKVAVYLLLRFLFSVFGVEFTFSATPAAEILMVLAALAMIVCSLSAIFQINTKRMLAYSSVSQVGYMLMGIALVNEAGLTGGISHMFNHAIIKACLFMAIGCVFYATGVTRTENLAGMGRTMPLTMGAFVIAGLGLIGVPGTAGFISKWYLVQGASEAGLWWIVAVIVVSSVMAIFYVGHVIEVAYFREPVAKVARKPPPEMVLLTLLLALAVLFFGLDTDLNGEVAAAAARELLAGWQS
ncbi:MAG: monovalent cation/H+ antiporter subunit D family protein [Paracoccaceae bacterium]